MFYSTTPENKATIERVYLDGQDITKRVFAFDNEHDWAMLYQTWPPTAHDFRHGVFELRTGKIDIVFRNRL